MLQRTLNSLAVGLTFSLLSCTGTEIQCVTFISTLDEVGEDQNKNTFNASRVQTSSESGTNMTV